MKMQKFCKLCIQKMDIRQLKSLMTRLKQELLQLLD
jgi:hypothetical protein